MRLIPALFLALLTLVLAACDQPIITNGKYITEEEADRIFIGMTTDDLLAAHGSPSMSLP